MTSPADVKKRQRSRAGQIGALRLHALHDSKELTKNARATAMSNLKAKLYAEIDQARPGISEADREEAFGRLWSAHFKSIRMKRKA